MALDLLFEACELTLQEASKRAGAMTDHGKRANGTCMGGYTMVELVVALAVILIMTGVSLPSFLRAYRAYQLTDAVTKIANLMKFTRLEAIRRNTPVNFRVLQAGAARNVWVDLNGNGNMDVGEAQLVFSSTVGPIQAGAAPGAGALPAAVGVPAVNNLLPTNATVTFDQRGAVNPLAVSALFVGNAALPNLGARAVILLPSGSVQVWSADAAGNWRLVN